MIASKISSTDLIDALLQGRLVHLGGSLGYNWKNVIGQVVAWFVNSNENAVAHEMKSWRSLIVSPNFSTSVAVATYAKSLIAVHPFRTWNSGGDCAHGNFRAVAASPLAVMNVNSTNMLWVVLQVEDKDVWQCIWQTAKPDTKILAVNSELYGQWNEFIHL